MANPSLYIFLFWRLKILYFIGKTYVANVNTLQLQFSISVSIFQIHDHSFSKVQLSLQNHNYNDYIYLLKISNISLILKALPISFLLYKFWVMAPHLLTDEIWAIGLLLLFGFSYVLCLRIQPLLDSHPSSPDLMYSLSSFLIIFLPFQKKGYQFCIH